MIEEVSKFIDKEFHSSSDLVNITNGSRKKFHWICPKNKKHKYIKSIKDRVNSLGFHGCPFCSGKKVMKEESFGAIFSEHFKFWDKKKNNEISPYELTKNSNKSVFWKCEKGHEWKQTIGIFVKKKEKCSECLKLKNSLFTKKPHLKKEWHTKKNKNIDLNIGAMSHMKVWWQCKNGHEYQMNVNAKTMGQGCPYCSGRRASKTNNFAIMYPHILKEWHPDKNKELDPKLLTHGSVKKIWWKCDKGHEYQQSIFSRVKNSYGCPYCSGRKFTYENSLAARFPRLIKEWHTEKNGDLKPENISYKNSLKVWWKCNKFDYHEWEASIGNRTAHNSGCPYCSNQTSFPEVRILSELKTIFSVVSRKKIKNKEIDIYLPDLKIGIEYDGAYWHRNKYETDKRKNKFFNDLGIKIIRIREKPLKIIDDLDLQIDAQKQIITKENIDKIIQNIKKLIVTTKFNIKINEYINKEKFQNEEDYKIYVESFPNPLPEKSLNAIYPNIAEEWDVKKNKPLLPENFSIGSKFNAWWLCANSHSWQMQINDRVVLKGCPYCSKKRVSNNYNFEELEPAKASEWNYEKNKNILPSEVHPKSGKKVWWKCKNGHEWQSSIAVQTNRKKECLICYKEKNNITTNKKLFSEIHLKLNKKINYEDLLLTSPKNLWWQCKKNKEHIWQAKLSNRYAQGTGCPYCAHKLPSADYNLSTEYPNIAKEWHPTKNGKLTPELVLPKTSKRVWWKCKNGHEFTYVISDRTNDKKDRTCNECKKLMVPYKKTLFFKSKKLSLEWHPTKNGHLTPKNISFGTQKKVWWKCKNGHEFEAIVNHRYTSPHCQYCKKEKKDSRSKLFITPKNHN